MTKVALLLHEASRAKAGRDLAVECNDAAASQKLADRLKKLLDLAESIDPDHEDAAWQPLPLKPVDESLFEFLKTGID